MIEDHFDRFLFVGSGLIEEQDKGDHNWFEELQKIGHLKKLQNGGWFDFFEENGRSSDEL